MPSDPRLARAFEILGGPIERYRSALAATLEEIRGHVDAARSDSASRSRRLRDQLGAFGGRIDTARLSVVLGERPEVDPADLERLERASDVLRNLVSRGHSLFEVEVPAGVDAAVAIRRQLACVGRGFAAARVARAASTGIGSGIDEGRALDAFPFAEWTEAERRLTPPLVVFVHGVDLVAGALAPLLDGSAKLLMIVEGFCPPAPLVRLITPGVLVAQAHDFSELQTLASAPYPSVGALVPLWAVRFSHDPAAGPECWQRMSVHHSRDWRIKRVGPFSPEQQQEELAQLDELARVPSPVSPTLPVGAFLGGNETGASSTPADPSGQARVSSTEQRVPDVDRLAAWLLKQADLTAVD